MVSNILGLFYGILAVDKDLLNDYFDDFHLIGFERHAKVYGLIFSRTSGHLVTTCNAICAVKGGIQTSTRYYSPVSLACRCCQ